MSYEIGTNIDLTYLNRKVVSTDSTKSFQTFLQEVGTRYKILPDGKAARLIPVV